MKINNPSNNLPAPAYQKVPSAILRIDTRPFVEACQRVGESIARLGEWLASNRSALVLPPGASVAFLEPRQQSPNGIRHARNPWPSPYTQPPRWQHMPEEPEPIRVRTCRGSRR